MVRVQAVLVVVVGVRDRGINADRAVLLMVDGADLESLLVTADEAGLLPAVARSALAHHRL